MASASRRNESLDVLRCIAVLLVLGHHFPYYHLWSRLGWIGIDLFFVLSGFLISGLLFGEYQKTGSINFKRFLVRRGLKIYPSFYLLVAITAGLSYIMHSRALRTQAIVSAFFVQNYYRGALSTMLAHTWSLAVEEHFYLLLPPLLMLLVAIRGKAEPFHPIPSLFAVLAASSLALRWFAPPASDAAVATHMSHVRMDSLFAGVTLRYFYDFRPALFYKLTGNYALALAFLFCLPTAILDLNNRVMQSFGLTGLLLGFSFLVAWSVVRTPRTLPGRALSKVAARIGFYSYSIYLWHEFVGLALIHSGVSFWRFWSYIAACIIGGVSMAYLVEMPYLALRERFFPPSQNTSDLSASSSERVALSPVNASPV